MRFRRLGGAAVSAVAAVVTMVSAGGVMPTSTPAAAAQSSSETTTLSITARPRWGHSLPGQWTSYLVEARNPTTSDFSGTVTLAAREAPASAPASTTSTRDVAQTPMVVAIGEVEFSVPEPEGPQGQPLPDPGPAHFPLQRSPFSLAAQSDKSLAMVVLEAPFGYRAELRDQSDRLVAVSPAPPVERKAPGQPDPPTERSASYAVLGDVDAGALPPDVRSDLLDQAAILRSPADMPHGAIDLAGLQGLVLARVDVGSLGADTRRAIVDFVALGGTLALAGPDVGRSAARTLPTGLVPLDPADGVNVNASLAPLADLVARQSDKVATVLTGKLRHGVVAIDTPDRIPLVVQSTYGLGRVVQLTYDPLGEPLVSDPLLRDVGWAQGVGRMLAAPAGAAGPGLNATADHQLWRPALGNREWQGWPRPTALALVGYSLAGAPLLYFVLRRRGPRAAMWMGAPLLALMACGVVASAASGQGRSVQPEVEVRTAAAGDTVLVETFRGAHVTEAAGGSIDLGDDVAAATVFGGPNPFVLPSPEFKFTGSGGGSVVRAPDGGEVVLRPEPRGARAFQALGVERGDGRMLESQLRLVESGPPEEGGAKVVGTIRNRSGTTVHKLRAQLPEGGLARLADSVEPGRTVEVDATFVWPRSIAAGSGLAAPGDEVVMYAAARRMFTQSGQVAVAGLLGRPSDPPAQGGAGGNEGEAGEGEEGGGGDARRSTVLPTTKVVVEIDRFEGDDGAVSNAFTRSAAIASIPSDSSIAGDFVAYEHSGSQGLGRLGLSYGTGGPGPEVYDWVSRTWRVMPAGNPSSGLADSLPLAPTEIGPGGLVRSRGNTLTNGAPGTVVPIGDR